VSFFSKLMTPNKQQKQQAVEVTIDGPDGKAKKLTLYLFESCPFCVRVLKVIKNKKLQLEMRDTMKNQQYEDELVRGGGNSQVPCLKITGNKDDYWMYESSDIIHYIEKQFA
jgi:glutaredoxin